MDHNGGAIAPPAQTSGLKERTAAALRALLRRPADFLLGSSSDYQRQRAALAALEQDAAARKSLPLPDPAVLSTPMLTAKMFPYAGSAPSYVIRPTPAEAAADGLPVPPQELWEGYGATVDEYLRQGQAHTDSMRRIASASGFPLESCRRILDFGCASGRMVRFLADLADAAEIWGVDINDAHMVWCQQHLSPPFRFATTTTFPHLPFEDGYFDFIYAGSVFTHISELADAWLLELRRITRPGGRLFISVHDRHCVQRLFELLPDFWLTQHIKALDRATPFLEQDFTIANIARSPYAQVVYDIDDLRRRWGRFLKVVSVHEEGYGIHTALLLEK